MRRMPYRRTTIHGISISSRVMPAWFERNCLHARDSTIPLSETDTARKSPMKVSNSG